MTFTTITYGITGRTKTRYVTETDRRVLHKACMVFTRDMIAKGYLLSEVIFVYGDPNAVGTVRGITTADFPNVTCSHETTTYAPGATNAHCVKCGVELV
jgi:hypothetical protein